MHTTTKKKSKETTFSEHFRKCWRIKFSPRTMVVKQQPQEKMINWDVIQIQNSKQVYIACVNICPHSFTQWTSVQTVLSVSTRPFFSYVYLLTRYMDDCVLMNFVNQILSRHETNYSHPCTANMKSRKKINLSRSSLSFLWVQKYIKK